MKTMKKFIYLFMVLGLVFTACDPMEDIYDDLDAQEKTISGDAVFTLTDDDYEELGVEGGFSSVDQAKGLLPAYLTDLYPVWGKGSSALIGYNLVDGLSNLGSVDAYANAEVYRLANTDYPGAADNAIGFYPNQDPEDYIGDILATTIVDPVEGDIVLAQYKQYVGEPVLGVSDYFSVDFVESETLSGFEEVSVIGDDQVWFGSRYGVQVSGYDSGSRYANEDWLISPEIDLTEKANILFQVNQAINYASGQLELMNILVSTDYTTGGDPNTSTWDVIDLTTKPDGTSWTFVLSEDYSFAAYEGETIHVAFKYESTTTIASTWEIGQATIKIPGVEGDTDSRGMYFTYNADGEWEASKDVYYLSDSDYDSMGESSGQPGRYNNFSSSTDPEGYLPAFLNFKFPYAQEEDALVVMYKYYSGSTNVRGNLYELTSGDWIGNNPSLQFGHDGTNWVPDNTIKYVLLGSDYSLIGDALIGKYPGPGGSASNYGNFDRREGNANYWSNDMLVEGFNILLDDMDPGAVEGQKYNMTFNVYTGASGIQNLTVIKTGGVWFEN